MKHERSTIDLDEFFPNDSFSLKLSHTWSRACGIRPRTWGRKPLSKERNLTQQNLKVYGLSFSFGQYWVWNGSRLRSRAAICHLRILCTYMLGLWMQSKKWFQDTRTSKCFPFCIRVLWMESIIKLRAEERHAIVARERKVCKMVLGYSILGCCSSYPVHVIERLGKKTLGCYSIESALGNSVPGHAKQSGH